jgi:hypothetical protein
MIQKIVHKGTLQQFAKVEDTRGYNIQHSKQKLEYNFKFCLFIPQH